MHEIKIQIENAIHRKRSKSSLAQMQNNLEKEVSFVKSKIEELEKRNEQSHHE